MASGVSFKITALSLALLATALLLPVAATNSDTAKESRWAEQVIDGLLDGEEVWLIDDSGHEFLSILTEGDRGSGEAVILIHGIGVHPNWPDVIYPLRAGLLERALPRCRCKCRFWQMMPTRVSMPFCLPKFRDESIRRWIILMTQVIARSRW